MYPRIYSLDDLSVVVDFKPFFVNDIYRGRIIMYLTYDNEEKPMLVICKDNNDRRFYSSNCYYNLEERTISKWTGIAPWDTGYNGKRIHRKIDCIQYDPQFSSFPQ